MVKFKFKGVTIEYDKVRKSPTLPNQSLTVMEIVRRYTKGLPVNVNRKEAVFQDQSEFDFEKMSRMDATEKAYQAGEWYERAESIEEQLKEQERVKNEQAMRKKRDEDARRKSETTSDGRDSLDNTLPDDTRQKTK